MHLSILFLCLNICCELPSEEILTNQCDSFSAAVPRGLHLTALPFHTTIVLWSLLQKNTSQTDHSFRLNSCALSPPNEFVSDTGKIVPAWLVAEYPSKFIAFMEKELIIQIISFQFP